MTENDYVSKRVQELEIELDDVERTVSLNNIVTNPEAERLLGLSEVELGKMTADECANAKYILLQHAIVIQKKLNRATAVKNWCDRGVTVILAKTYKSFGDFVQYEVRREMVALNDGYAARLREISVEQQEIIGR